MTRHARVLEQAGLVRSTRSAQGTTYELATQLFFSDDEYGTLSDASREAAVAAALAHTHTAAAAALEGGGFDRDDVHVSRTALRLDERQWEELSGAYAELLGRIEALKAAGPQEGEEISASAVLMLFERPGAEQRHRAPAQDDQAFSMSEGVERSWDLTEELERILSASATDWPAVIALADQLRVLARAALANELQDRAPQRDTVAEAAITR